jgi:hypothetical protein
MVGQQIPGMVIRVHEDGERGVRKRIIDPVVGLRVFMLEAVVEVFNDLVFPLRSILYHNLAKVDFVYDTALQVKILKLISDKSRLFNAIKLRHDCVHRNGFDKDGNELIVFTKQFVQETAELIKDFVAEIEAAVQGIAGCLASMAGCPGALSNRESHEGLGLRRKEFQKPGASLSCARPAAPREAYNGIDAGWSDGSRSIRNGMGSDQAGD